MMRAVPADVLVKIIRTIPAARLGRPEDIANSIAFLLDDESSFITGSTLSINGGKHMYQTAIAVSLRRLKIRKRAFRLFQNLNTLFLSRKSLTRFIKDRLYSCRRRESIRN